MPFMCCRASSLAARCSEEATAWTHAPPPPFPLLPPPPGLSDSPTASSNRSTQRSVTMGVRKEGVAETGTLKVNDVSAMSDVISWCSACSLRMTPAVLPVLEVEADELAAAVPPVPAFGDGRVWGEGNEGWGGRGEGGRGDGEECAHGGEGGGAEGVRGLGRGGGVRAKGAKGGP